MCREAELIEGVIPRASKNNNNNNNNNTDEQEQDVFLLDVDDDQWQVDDHANRGIFNDCPANMGYLGEKYAAQWLDHQSWIESGSVVWMNKDKESHHEYDIQCKPIRGRLKGRCNVEVKTHWKGCAKTRLSRNQRDRAMQGNFMVMVIGNFSEYFATPSVAPLVRIFYLDSSPPSVVAPKEKCSLVYKVDVDLVPFVNKKIRKRVGKASNTSIRCETREGKEAEIEIRGDTLSCLLEAKCAIGNIPVVVKFNAPKAPQSILRDLQSLYGVKSEAKFFYVEDSVQVTFRGTLVNVSLARCRFLELLDKTTPK